MDGILLHIYEGLYDGAFKYGMNARKYEYKKLCIMLLMSCIHITLTI
jgi:hypothetical protein